MGENMYNEILEKINEYNYFPEVINNKDIISAYDLNKILSERFYKLENIMKNEELVNYFNEYFKEQGGFFKNLLQKYIGKKGKFCIVENCYDVTMYGNSKKVYMNIETSIKREPYYLESNLLLKRKGSRSINIYKDKGSNFINIDEIKDDDVNVADRKASDERAKKFITDNYDIILKNLKKLENELNFLDFSAMGEYKFIKQSFDDGFIGVKFLLSDYGEYSLDCFLINENYNDYAKNDFIGVKNLKDILDDNRDLILKKIPIQVDKLNKTFKIVAEDYLSKNVSTSSNKETLNSYNRLVDSNFSIFSLVNEVRNKYEESEVHTSDTDKAYLEFLYSVIDFKDSLSDINNEGLKKVYDKIDKFYNTFNGSLDDNINIDSSGVKVLKK